MIRVIVDCEEGLPADMEAQCLFNFERNLRELTGLDVWVLKRRMEDDSPLRKKIDFKRAQK